MARRPLKKKIVRALCIDERVEKKFRAFQKRYPRFTVKDHPLANFSYIWRLNWQSYRRRKLDEVRLPRGAAATSPKGPYWDGNKNRLPLSKMIEKLSAYDVISFDIFDTAIYRKVAKPADVFRIMSLEMNYPTFINIRPWAEAVARKEIDRLQPTNRGEIQLSDIYDILENEYGVERKWEKREMDLELSLCLPNPYIKRVYDALLADGKTLVFTSDMYLPRNLIEKMLSKCGYEGYAQLYLSNENHLHKVDGSQQRQLAFDHPKQKIVHVGDNPQSDVQQSKKAGIAAIWNPDQRKSPCERNMYVLAGSLYRAVVNNSLNSGCWNESLLYTHGFRVGGVIAVGYCQYLNELAHRHNATKILFCARDCEVVWRIYNECFREMDNDYLAISRTAIMSVTLDRYLRELAGCTLISLIDSAGSSMTLSQAFQSAGFGYLIPHFPDAGLNGETRADLTALRDVEKFVIAHRNEVEAHCANTLKAAKRYFSDMVGDHQSIIVADVGWSGTCITALQHFFKTHLPEKKVEIHGALICANQGGAASSVATDGSISAYICSPMKNIDLMDAIHPPTWKNGRKFDLVKLPLEYLFTSNERSLIAYSANAEGRTQFIRAKADRPNPDEVLQIQDGMIGFARVFTEYSREVRGCVDISPYVAFRPYADMLKHRDYVKKVYANFPYDAVSTPGASSKECLTFGEVYDSILKKGTVS